MLGWLHATPEGEKESRMVKEDWPMPDVELGYLVGWFAELRLTFGYQDIVAWSNLTGNIPNPIEVALLISMSAIYSNSLIKYRSKEHNLTPPYDGRTQEQIDEMIADKMRRSFARFK